MRAGAARPLASESPAAGPTALSRGPRGDRWRRGFRAAGRLRQNRGVSDGLPEKSPEKAEFSGFHKKEALCHRPRSPA